MTERSRTYSAAENPVDGPVKPPFPYYGGKGRLAPWIASLLPPHRVYVEPFCGSAAVLFAKARATHEIVNDANGDLVTFLRVLRDRPDDLEVACRLTPYARAEFALADLRDPDLDELEIARRWWVRVCQSFARTDAYNTGWSTSIKRGSNNARTAWNRTAYFAQIAERLGTVTIENLDALAVIERYGTTVDGAIYADPPYLGSTRSSYGGDSGRIRRPGGDYVHEFHTDDQHRALAEVLGRSPAFVIVSGYSSPLYEDLYAGWHRVERRVLRQPSNGQGGKNFHAQEVLWSNRPLERAGGQQELVAAIPGSSTQEEASE